MRHRDKIEKYKNLCSDETIIITQHTNRRFQDRKIFLDDIESAIFLGKIIEEYPEDKPLPSCLILGKSSKNLPLHIVANVDEEFLYIITAYYPSKEKWENNFETRKEKNSSSSRHGYSDLFRSEYPCRFSPFLTLNFNLSIIRM